MISEPLVWLVFIACLGLSFVLSGMEAGVFALSRLRVRQQLRAGRASARVLHGFLENPENFLWTILVGNTLANFIILGWIVTMLHQAMGQYRIGFIVVFAIIVFWFYTFFDLLPKMLFRTYPNRLCMMFARPFRLLHLVLRPMVSVVEWASGILLRWRGGNVFTGHLFGNRQELREVMQESAQALTSEERAMINRVLDLQTLTVRQVMKPLEKAVMVSAAAPVSELLSLCRDGKLTRLPVWDIREGQKRIVGVATLKNLVFHDDLALTRRVGDQISPALYLDEDLRLEVALRRMQRGGQRFAIVLGRDRKESGMLTIQDILGVIFGEVSF
jgi:CBS domain containing-hemolysin-like protein